MQLDSLLRPDSWTVRFQGITLNSDRIGISMEAAHLKAPCPRCGGESTWVHSHYQRTLADPPWYRRHVEIHWQSRRFFSDVASCPQRIFPEWLPEVASAHARRSSRLLEALRAVALGCGGEGRSRLSQRLGMYVSADTLLRLIRRQPAPPAPAPRVLGVEVLGGRHGQRLWDDLVRSGTSPRGRSAARASGRIVPSLGRYRSRRGDHQP